MSVEITPVSAFTPAGTDNAAAVDSRRYTQYDRTATEAGETHMSFGDFLDMINPLQHIPVISSVYRAVTGESIHPVSRVAGDLLYGGVFGVASAVMGTASAVADASLESGTGKDSSGVVLAALFGIGEDKDKTVQLADAGKTAPAETAPPAPPAVLASADRATAVPAAAPQNPVLQEIQIAQAAPPSPQIAALAVTGDAAKSLPAASAVSSATDNSQPAIDMAALKAEADAAAMGASPAPLPSPAPASAAALPPAAAAPVLASNASANLAADAAANPSAFLAANANSPGLSLANAKHTNKQPYGGVMAPVNGDTAQQMAQALSQGNPATRMGQTIFANKLAKGYHGMAPQLSTVAPVSKKSVSAPPPTVPAPPFTPISASDAAASTVPATVMTPGGPMSAAALQDMMVKAIGQYQGASSYGGVPGLRPNVNYIN